MILRHQGQILGTDKEKSKRKILEKLEELKQQRIDITDIASELKTREIVYHLGNRFC